jgi:nitrite reductase (NADH) large subunit
VYAAGDVARAPTCGGVEGVLALWPVAVAQGRIAGANLAGAGLEYEGGLSGNVTEMFGVTVASVGRFDEAPGERVVVLDDHPGAEYLKVVLDGDVPVGAVYLGDQQGVRLLGRLSPFIRHGRPLGDVRAFFEERRFPGVTGAASRSLHPLGEAVAARGESLCVS